MTFELAKNKLHEQGGSYLLVLPKKWVKNNGLSKGDQMSIMLEKDGSLKLVPSKEEST